MTTKEFIANKKDLSDMSKRKIVSWAAVLAWMAVIFILSHQPGTISGNLSSGITDAIIKTVEKVVPDAGMELRDFHHIVRKNAHFIAYFTLGILTVNALRKSGVRSFRSAAAAFGISVLYAISDEVHQLFIPGRSGEAKDVLIDSSGAFVGICVYWVFEKILKKNNQHQVK